MSLCCEYVVAMIQPYYMPLFYIPLASQQDIRVYENPIPLLSSGPPIDPDNTREYIPEWFSPVATLSQCTHDGRSYYDERNDFGLEIPEGAIPSITIDIGVALYGPFQYPEGLRPVSPVFWVCVRDQKLPQLLKPVKVTIPHCINLEKFESLRLTFLKGEHVVNSEKKHGLTRFDTYHTQFEQGTKCGVLSTRQFCTLCITCDDRQPDFYDNVDFCLFSVLPKTLSAGAIHRLFFFVMFSLNTCRDNIRKRISDGMFPVVGEHEEVVEEFQFLKRRVGHDDVRIVLPKEQDTPKGLFVGGEFNTPASHECLVALFYRQVAD